MDRSERGPGPVDGDGAATYSVRCRAVVDSVLACYAEIGDAVDGDGWSWLETQLVVAAATPGTVAELLLRTAPPPPSPEPLPAILRTVAWLRLGGPADAPAWGKGPNSPYLWSLLLAPAPVDQHDEWWLATINRLPPERVAALTLGRNSLPAHAPVKRRTRRPTEELER